MTTGRWDLSAASQVQETGRTPASTAERQAATPTKKADVRTMSYDELGRVADRTESLIKKNPQDAERHTTNLAKVLTERMHRQDLVSKAHLASQESRSKAAKHAQLSMKAEAAGDREMAIYHTMNAAHHLANSDVARNSADNIMAGKDRQLKTKIDATQAPEMKGAMGEFQKIGKARQAAMHNLAARAAVHRDAAVRLSMQAMRESMRGNQAGANQLTQQARDSHARAKQLTDHIEKVKKGQSTSTEVPFGHLGRTFQKVRR